MVLILQDPLWRLYNLAFLHTTGIARFKVCFCRLVLRDTAAIKLCSKFDFSSLVSWRSAHLVSIWQNVSQSIQNTHCKNELELCSVRQFWSTQNSSFLQKVYFSGTEIISVQIFKIWICMIEWLVQIQIWSKLKKLQNMAKKKILIGAHRDTLV